MSYYTEAEMAEIEAARYPVADACQVTAPAIEMALLSPALRAKVRAEPVDLFGNWPEETP